MDLDELIEAASLRALVRLSDVEKVAVATVVQGIVATLDRKLEQGRMLEDIASYPLGIDPLLASSLNTELVGMQIRHTESDNWVPNFDMLIRGLLKVVIQLRESGADFPVLARTSTVYTLIAYALRRQISN